MIRPSRQPLLAAIQQITKCVPLPAPQQGINAVDGLAAMKPDEAVFLYNLIPSQYGSKVRTGYKEFATNVGANGIRTIIPFTGPSTSADRLFALAEGGIYNITAGGAGPWAAAIAFGTVDATSGYGIWTNFTTIAGHFSLYTDETNGYYVYTESTGLWAKVTLGGGATQISGVDPANLAYCAIFKSRVWFILKNSAKAYYLPVGSVFGAATEFNFGNKFKRGGTLVALYNWTVDGGEGVDDYLVAVSSTGDVIVYKGNDPSTATDFLQHGSWYIGQVPAGRRIGGSFGGEVYLLSNYGVLPMSKLISGQLIQQQDVYLTKKVAPVVQGQMQFTLNTLGWEMKTIPSEQLMLLSAPKRTGFPFTQFVQSLNNEAWAIYQDLPYFTGEVWHEVFYFGTSENIVYTHEGNLDNVNLAETTSEQIEWSGLQTFQDYGEPGVYHRAHFIRPVFIAEQAPTFNVEARFDYNLGGVVGIPSMPGTTGAVWDSAIWDAALWVGDFVTIDNPVGAAGMGRAITVAISGRSGAKTILIRYDMMMDSGGFM